MKKTFIIFIISILVPLASYAKQQRAVAHAHNGKKHTHVLPNNGQGHHNHRGNNRTYNKKQRPVTHVHNGKKHTHVLPNNGRGHHNHRKNNNTKRAYYKKQRPVAHIHSRKKHTHIFPNGQKNHTHNRAHPKKSVVKNWIYDQNNCLHYNPQPLPNETITWSGKCKNNYAEGYGRRIWYKNGKRNQTQQVTLAKGKKIKEQKIDRKIGNNRTDFKESLGKNWIYDQNKCIHYNEDPQTGENLRWTGGCKNNYAEGYGRRVWRSSRGQMIGLQHLKLAKGKHTKEPLTKEERAEKEVLDRDSQFRSSVNRAQTRMLLRGAGGIFNWIKNTNERIKRDR